MLGHRHRAIAIACLTLLLLTAPSREARADGPFDAAPAVEAARPSPMHTRLARGADRVTLDLGWHYFRGVRMQEAKRFRGWGARIELTVPLQPLVARTQVRVIWPVYTVGRAFERDVRERLTIEGYGGVFEYPTVMVDHLLLTEQQVGFNLALSAGVGYMVSQDFSILAEGEETWDQYNHSGTKFLAGVQVDKDLPRPHLTVAGQVLLEYWYHSDDLHPDAGGNEFVIVTSSGAAVYRGLDLPLYPAAEVIYRTDGRRFHALSASPQVAVALHPRADLTLAAPIGLTRKADHIRLESQLSLRF